MIPASATARSRVGDHEVVRVERARRAVERAQLLALLRAADDDRPPPSVSKSKACSGFPSASIT